MNTILVSLTLILVIVTLGAGYRQLAVEIAVDGDYTRLAFLALTPVQVFLTLVRPQIPRRPSSLVVFRL